MSSRRLFIFCFIFLAGLYALGYFVLKPNDGATDPPIERIPDLKLRVSSILPPNTSLLAESPELSLLFESLGSRPAGRSLHLNDAELFLRTFASMPESTAAQAWLAELRKLNPGHAFVAAVPTIREGESEWIGGFATKASRSTLDSLVTPAMKLMEGDTTGRADLINHRGWVVKTYLSKDASPSWACNRGWFLFSTNKDLLLAGIDQALGDTDRLSLDQDPYINKLLGQMSGLAELTCMMRGPFPEWTGWPNGELAWTVTNGADRLWIQGQAEKVNYEGKPDPTGEELRNEKPPGIPIHPQSIPRESSLVYGGAHSGHALLSKLIEVSEADPNPDTVELLSILKQSTQDSFAVMTLGLDPTQPGGRDPAGAPSSSLHFLLPVTDPAALAKLSSALELHLDAIPILDSSEEPIAFFPPPRADRQDSFRHPLPRGFGILLHPEAVALTTRREDLIPHLGQSTDGLAAGRGDIRRLSELISSAPKNHREFLAKIFGSGAIETLQLREPAEPTAQTTDNLALRSLLATDPGTLRYFAARSSENGSVIATTQGKTSLSQYAFALIIDHLVTSRRNKLSDVWRDSEQK